MLALAGFGRADPWPGVPGCWWDSNTRPPVSGPGEKPGPRLLSNWGPRGGADQTCRAGLRARLGEGAAPAPSPPPPQVSKTKAECLLRGCVDNGPGILPPAQGGAPPASTALPPSLVPAPPLGQEGSALAAGRGSASPPRPRRDPFGEGPVGSWKSWERGLCVSAHLGHPSLSTSLIVFVALTVYQTL